MPVPCPCHVIFMHSSCVFDMLYFHVIAMCHLHTFVMSLTRHYHAPVMSLSCLCHVFVMSLPRHLHAFVMCLWHAITFLSYVKLSCHILHAPGIFVIVPFSLLYWRKSTKVLASHQLPISGYETFVNRPLFDLLLGKGRRQRRKRRLIIQNTHFCVCLLVVVVVVVFLASKYGGQNVLRTASNCSCMFVCFFGCVLCCILFLLQLFVCLFACLFVVVILTSKYGGPKKNVFRTASKCSSGRFAGEQTS